MRGSRFIQLALPVGKGFVLKMMEEQASALTVHQISHDRLSLANPRKGRNGQYTKELWIDRRENSKSLAWSSVLLALNNIKEVGAVVDGPKALGDIRGVTYIYGMFYRFGLIDMPDKVNGKMKRAGRQM